MTLAELSAPFERKKIITYASDNTTAVIKNKELQHIVGTIYKGRTKVKGSQTSCRLYCYFGKYQIGIDLERVIYPEFRTVEEIETAMQKRRLSTPDDLIAELDERVSKGGFIPNAYIKLAEYIAPERASTYFSARDAFLEKRARIEAEQKAKREEEECALQEQRKLHAEGRLRQAVSIMLSDGVLENTTLEGCSIINYIARKFGVVIPIKVQGWINKSLVSVAFKGGAPVRYSYRGNKSKTFPEYFEELIEAVEHA